MIDLIKVEVCLQKLQNHLSEEFIGIIKYPDFALYEGCIKNLKANGIGFFYKPPGNKEFYGGEFSDGVIQGYGIMKENESFGLYKNGIIQKNWNFEMELKEEISETEEYQNKEMELLKKGMKMVRVFSKKEKKMKIFVLET